MEADGGLGQCERVTVEYMLADGTLDVYIADLLETKLRLISAVETDEPLDGLDARGPPARARPRAAAVRTGLPQARQLFSNVFEKLAVATPRAPESPLLSGGVQQFRSSRVVRDLRNVRLDGLPQAPQPRQVRRQKGHRHA
jgi:hypothetical protein